jgi:gamma-glutamylputrescine oxidase
MAAPGMPAPLSGSHRARIAIVGGGFSGLSAAYHLIREDPARDIVLLEAEHVGAGASGRNTGMAGPGVQGTIGALRKKHGDTGARLAFEATLDAVRRVVALVHDEKLDCDMEITGQLKVATTELQSRSLRAQVDDFAELGFEIPYLDRRELRDWIGTDAYVGALRYPGATLSPGKLCAGLRDSVQRHGVRIFEQSRVTRIRPGSPVQLDLAAGRVLADQVVLATNGYTAQLGLLQGQVWPLHTHIVRTAPLGVAQRQGLGWPGREAIIESRQIFNYFRLDPQDRLIFGGAPPCYRAAPESRELGALSFEAPRAYAQLHREIERIFPSLQGVEIEDRWSGMMGLTIDMLPVVTWVHPNVLFVGAWCGHGVALATASGALVADLLSGRATDASRVPWVRPRAPRLPPDPLRGWGIGAYVSTLNWSDRLGAAFDAWAGGHRGRTA